MLPSRVVLAALAVPPTGTVVALLLNSIPLLAALVGFAGMVMAAVPVFIDCRIRWQRHRSWMNDAPIRTRALERVAQDHPELVVGLQLPSGGPFATAAPAGGPAPPAAQLVRPESLDAAHRP